MNDKATLNQLIALVIIAIAAAIVAVVLAVVAANIDTYRYGYGGGTDTKALAAQASVVQWSNFLMMVAAVATVGAIVLSGVQTLLKRLARDVRDGDREAEQA